MRMASRRADRQLDVPTRSDLRYRAVASSRVSRRVADRVHVRDPGSRHDDVPRDVTARAARRVDRRGLARRLVGLVGGEPAGVASRDPQLHERVELVIRC